MMRAGDVVELAVIRCDEHIVIAARFDGQEGIGSAPNIGTLAKDVAALRAMRDLKIKLDASRG